MLYLCVYNAGCPSIIRMDRGTENTKIAALQYSFREDHSDEYAGIRMEVTQLTL